MRVDDFDFHLPSELIAQQPPATRGCSRMLLLGRYSGQIQDRSFNDLPSVLRSGDLLVLNDSRVLPARLFATRSGLHTQPGSPRPAGSVEVLLTERIISPPVDLDGADSRDHLWRALVKPAKKVSIGEDLFFASRHGEAPRLRAKVVAAGEYGERTLRFEPTENLFAVLEEIGHLPLPPYIRRERSEPNTAADRARYQTVYSRPFAAAAPLSSQANEGTGAEQTNGSAAAPTAGLHFTPEILDELTARGVEIARITLHVGLGTFQPVRVDRTEDIRLHVEPYSLGPAAAEALTRAYAQGRRILAVGTTATRTLEHLARRFEAQHGALSAQNPLRLEAHTGATGLFLSPSPDGDDRFLLVQGLLTNFHLPQSTLLMLVSAFAGRPGVLAAYAHAVAARYRFFSYGDCMLIQ